MLELFNWFPNALCPLECLTGHGQDSQAASWTTWGATLTVGILYCIILWRWWIIFNSSPMQRALMGIFLLCAICGYWMFNLSFFNAPLAYSIRLIGLFGLIFFCVKFIRSTLHVRLEVHREMQSLQQLQHRAMSVKNLKKQIRLQEEMRRHKEELESLI